MKTKQPLEKGLSTVQTLPKILFILFFLFIGLQQVNAQRAMYVTLAKQTSWNPNVWTSTMFDNTGTTVSTELESMLQYAKDNHITYLILYKVSEVIEAGHSAGLEAFIRKAKAQYCITKIGVNVYSGSIIGRTINDGNDLDPSNDILEEYVSADDKIKQFNNDPNHDVKFDASVCESEF
jgi:hypothetical protein